MQAVFILSLVTMIMAIMGSMIAGGTSGASQLTADRITETRTLFTDISKVILNDITRQHLHANPQGITDPAEYIRNMPAVKQLASGRYADPAADAWGNPIQGRIFTTYENLQTSSAIRVVVPVTGFAFVSGGPDGIIQTNLPTVTQLSQIIGITAPQGSDDIVLNFHNRGAQEEQFAVMRASLSRIGSAAVGELKARLSILRQERLEEYQRLIAAGQAADASMLDITMDPCTAEVPCFLPLDNTDTGIANRRRLGIDGEFDSLQRTVDGGRMEVVAVQPATLADPMVLRLRNSDSPTTWGNPRNSFNYQIEVIAIE